jgi:hypothetical protein
VELTILSGHQDVRCTTVRDRFDLHRTSSQGGAAVRVHYFATDAPDASSLLRLLRCFCLGSERKHE